jgi:hypothetical protein
LSLNSDNELISFKSFSDPKLNIEFASIIDDAILLSIALAFSFKAFKISSSDVSFIFSLIL